MPYRLSAPEAILTRPNNTTTQGAFTVISAADNSCFVIPLLNINNAIIQGARITIDWASVPNNNNIRLFFFTSNPVPTFANVNGSGIGGTSLLGLFAQFEHVQNIVLIDNSAGFSSGTAVFSPPLVVQSPGAVLYAICYTTTGFTTPPANGRFKLDLFIENEQGVI